MMSDEQWEGRAKFPLSIDYAISQEQIVKLSKLTPTQKFDDALLDSIVGAGHWERVTLINDDEWELEEEDIATASDRKESE